VQRLAQEHEVICLVRRTSTKADTKFLTDLGVEIVHGDITQSLPKQDFDVAYHLAGILGDFNTPDEDYHKTHVMGTQNVLDLCNGQKFIYSSSAGVLGPVVGGDETSLPNPTNVYEKSKARAEGLVSQYDNHVVIRPEFVYGPYDFHVLQLFRAIDDKKFMLIGNGTSMLHPTHVDDVIHCLINSLNVKNETFVVAGQRPVSVREFSTMVADILGTRIPGFRLPLILARLYVQFEGMFRKAGMIPPLTRSRLDFFTKSRTFKTEKAQRILGYRPVNLEEGLKKTIEWYKEEGYL